MKIAQKPIYALFAGNPSIIFPDVGYQEALEECNIATLHQQHQWLVEHLFNGIKDNRPSQITWPFATM